MTEAGGIIRRSTRLSDPARRRRERNCCSSCDRIRSVDARETRQGGWSG
jgi:hypothetical protein